MLKKYFQSYESQEDDDYNPTKQQQAIYKLEHERKTKVSTRKCAVQDLWQQLQSQHKQKLKKTKPNQQHGEQRTALEVAQSIINNEQMKPDQRIIFAGKQFSLNPQTGQLQIIQKPKLTAFQLVESFENCTAQQIVQKKTKIAYHYLNHVMKAIYNRSRKINSIGKSKLDWNGFVKQQGIQHKLNYNRKGGVIKDIQFINKIN